MKIYQVTCNYNIDDYDILLFKDKKMAIKYVKSRKYIKQLKDIPGRYINKEGEVADIVDRLVF